ncbi:hypothetical protein [Halapricum desulfuricans]|uniref:Uncharacterized protein n=1 Tax=Halapricum desulfuricans TaxID=2841257 RepID=A0A897N5W2_9EURY|nr:hypothetical protein [Halapricum desulfuricans]QSG06449.1 hypothetical protein HSR121_2118 [Halapricum desulfuricans]
MTERCPTCGREIAAITTTGPAEHTFAPCGHTAAIDLKTATGGIGG